MFAHKRHVYVGGPAHTGTVAGTPVFPLYEFLMERWKLRQAEKKPRPSTAANVGTEKITEPPKKFKNRSVFRNKYCKEFRENIFWGDSESL